MVLLLYTPIRIFVYWGNIYLPIRPLRIDESLVNSSSGFHEETFFLDTSSWQPTFNLVISNSICVCFLSCKHYTDLHERRSMHSRRIVPTLISCYTALWPWPGDRKINRSLSFHGHNHYTNLHDRLSNHYRDIVLNNVKLLSWRFISFQCLSYRRCITKITQI